VLCITCKTLPPPAAAQVPSPRQNVDALADVPEFRLETGRLPVTPLIKLRPVALFKLALVGVPILGVIRTGEVIVMPVAIKLLVIAVNPILSPVIVADAIKLLVRVPTAILSPVTVDYAIKLPVRVLTAMELPVIVCAWNMLPVRVALEIKLP